MTQVVAIRTALITSFTLLLCNSIVCAQEGFPTVVGESNATPAAVSSAEKNVDKSNPAQTQLDSAIPQARPGERVSNPDHLILNSDTTLGGGETEITSLNDFSYLGPGDMRTHLWNGHSRELTENGFTENKVMAMTATEAQKWHNHFHGAEGSPEHSDDDGEQIHLDTIIQLVQQPTMPLSPTYANAPIDGTIVYGNPEYDDSGYPQSVYAQPGIVYEQGVIIDGSIPYGFEGVQTQMQPIILNQGLIQSWPTDR